MRGTTHILVSDDRFANSYQEGYFSFKVKGTTGVITDGAIYHLLAQRITSILHTDYEKAGFIVGWIAALLEGPSMRHRPPLLLSPEVGEIKDQLGQALVMIDKWESHPPYTEEGNGHDA